MTLEDLESASNNYEMSTDSVNAWIFLAAKDKAGASSRTPNRRRYTMVFRAGARRIAVLALVTAISGLLMWEKRNGEGFGGEVSRTGQLSNILSGLAAKDKAGASSRTPNNRRNTMVSAQAHRANLR